MSQNTSVGADRQPPAFPNNRLPAAMLRIAMEALFNKRATMSRKKPTARVEFVLFDVYYEDGTRTSNRKVPGGELGGLEGDTPARAIIEAQDQKIAENSGRNRGPIKSLVRSD
jgi:hypothetical protein